ncbi:hypothetical protein I7I50_10662 [Histoplasma capsulatum G186AR]|uniref:Secreted protein n=1 Tax=Ajellomyces capsulatus TaxID=5037 RepID=A0A8H7Z4L4_AJECA|nr:hypothetical protein I7I52_01900 [Histoplasma capsulatum]QSS69385.1 hypothetical protein I7I50_10662 [Histoplasma capsulatum G186AR]
MKNRLVKSLFTIASLTSAHSGSCSGTGCAMLTTIPPSLTTAASYACFSVCPPTQSSTKSTGAQPRLLNAAPNPSRSFV